MRRRAPSGQAAAEYISLLLVIGALLALGAVAVPGIGERVAATVRTGLCIVGGDVCRASDAAAAGLAPCVTSARSNRQDTAVDLAVVRLGGHGEWQLALSSDGTATVTRLEENELGATVGVGLEFSPAGLKADATATFVAGYRGGSAWRFAGARAAGEFLDAAMHDASVHEAREPDVRWRAIGGGAEGRAGVTLAELARAGVIVDAASAIGLRSDGARRTLTLDLAIHEPSLAAAWPGVPATPGTGRAWAADVSWDGGGAVRELALRSAVAADGRLEEITARLDLRDAANRAVAERLLRARRPPPAALRALAERIRTHGVVERNGYRVTERRRGLSIAGRLGLALGLRHQRITTERRLVDAVASIRGGRPVQRFDCLGV